MAPSNAGFGKDHLSPNMNRQLVSNKGKWRRIESLFSIKVSDESRI